MHADAEYAAERLRGTVWENWSPARVAYRALLGLGGRLGSIGISANILTATALALAGVSAVAAAYGQFAVAALALAFSGICDALDGVVARSMGTTSVFGALLDSTVDRLADALPLLGLVAFYRSDALVLVPAAAMIAVFAVSYVRARSEALNIKLPPLYMRRAERTLMLVALLLLGEIPVRGMVPAPVLLFGIAVLGLLSLTGFVAALRAAYRALMAARR
jgi:CDP-diacylglycerol---glycerol-3-phosphate 3-phosphatidyltransferase